MESLVSIVMPNYNGAKYIEFAIKSVINQTHKNWELLVIDDGSKDGSEKIVEEFIKKDSRIKLFFHPNKANKKVSATRNLGLANANGDYIALLDNDDVWNENKLERQLNVFNKYADVGIVYSQLTTLFDGVETDFPKICGSGAEGENKDAFKAMVKDELWMPNSSVIFKKEVLKRVPQFDEKLKYQVEDHLFFTKVVYFFNCYFLKESLGDYRMHNTSYTFTTKWQNSIDEFLMNLLLDKTILSKIFVLKVIYSRRYKCISIRKYIGKILRKFSSK